MEAPPLVTAQARRTLGQLSFVAQVRLLVELCSEYRLETSDDVVGPIAERMIGIGRDGTPHASDFLALEVGALLGTSSGAATERLADALDLTFRHPRLWGSIQELIVPVWQATKIVSRAAS